MLEAAEARIGSEVPGVRIVIIVIGVVVDAIQSFGLLALVSGIRSVVLFVFAVICGKVRVSDFEQVMMSRR